MIKELEKLEELKDSKNLLENRLVRHEQNAEAYHGKQRSSSAQLARLETEFGMSDKEGQSRIIKNMSRLEEHLDQYRGDLYRASNKVAALRQEIGQLRETIKEQENKVKKLRDVRK